MIAQENEQKRLQREAERAQKIAEARARHAQKRQVYKSVHRCENDDEDEENKYDTLEPVQRCMGEYIACGNKERVMFSNIEPDLLFQELLDYAEKNGTKFETSKDRYKIQMEFNVKMDHNTFPVDVVAKILKVDDDKVCIEVKKTGGELMAFYQQYDEIEEYLIDFII